MSADIKFMVETPLAHRFPDARNFREAVRLAQLTKDRLVLINRVGEGIFLAVDIEQERSLVFPLQHPGRRSPGESRQPDGLLFDNRIEHKLSGIRQLFRKTHLELIVKIPGQTGNLQPTRVARRRCRSP